MKIKKPSINLDLGKVKTKEQYCQWALDTCLAFGSTLETALKVSSCFAKEFER